MKTSFIIACIVPGLALAAASDALADSHWAQETKIKKRTVQAKAQKIVVEAKAEEVILETKAPVKLVKAEKYQAEADKYQAKAEKYRAKAEKYRAKAEKYRAKAEKYRALAEKCRALAEKYRAKAEKYRAKAEAKKAKKAQKAKKAKAMKKKYHDIHPLELPDLTSATSLSVETTYLRLDEIPAYRGVEELGPGIDVYTAEIAGQLEVAPGLFIFGNIPVAHVRQMDEHRAKPQSDLGNISGGMRLIGGTGQVLGGVSLAATLPTSPEFGEGEGNAAILAALARFDRFGNFMPETSGLRTRGHLRVAFSRGYIQGLVGYERYSIGLNDSRHQQVRTVISAGIEATDKISVIGEWTGLSFMLDKDKEGPFRESLAGEMDSWLQVGARYSGDNTDLGARVFVPLKSPLCTERNEVGAIAELRLHY